MPLTKEEKKARQKEASRRHYLRNRERILKESNERARKNRDSINARRRERRKQDPSFREKENLRTQEWRAENPELAKAFIKEWAESPRGKAKRAASQSTKEAKESALRSQRKWSRKNPGRCVALTAKRRARKKNATRDGFPVTDAVIAERKALTDGCCFCGSDAPKTLEHVIALEAGGLHIPSNLLGSCHSCNSSKGARPVEEWYRAQPFFSEERWQLIQELTNG